MATVQMFLPTNFGVQNLDYLLAKTISSSSESVILHEDGLNKTQFSGIFNDEGHYPDWTGTVTALSHTYVGNVAFNISGLNVAYPSVLNGFDYPMFIRDALAYGDTIYGSQYADWLNGFADNDQLWGGAGNDTIEGGDGNDTIDGDSGDDLFLADAAVSGDVIEGDEGVDTISFANVGGAVTLNLSVTTAQNVEGGTFTGIEAAIGSGYGDRLTGNSVANSLWGQGGNDTLTGAAGNDRLDGGAGIDTVVFITGTAVTANLTAGTASSVGEGADVLFGIESLASGNGADNLVGNSLANQLSSGAGNDTLSGMAGNDTLLGGTGNDLLAGGAGNDRLDGGAGDDTALFGTSTAVTANLTTGTASSVGEGTDVLIGIENLTTGNGADKLSGNSLANMLTAGAGSDTLSGLAGNDSLLGGDGNDVLQGGAGNDRMDGGAGIDTAVFTTSAPVTANLTTGIASSTGEGADTLVGVENLTTGIGADNLSGNSLANVLIAGAGNDTLSGLAGNDSLAGGTGNDVLTGGTGADSFVFTAGDGADRITDFQDGIDRIRIDVAPGTTVNFTITDLGADIRVAWGNNSVVLVNFEPQNFTTADIVLF